MAVEAGHEYEVGHFDDERMLGHCPFCGGNTRDLAKAKRSKDHVPSKSILLAPLPQNLPTVVACKHCNERWSKSEEYFVAFLSVVLSGSVEPNQQKIPAARGILNNKEYLQDIFAGGVTLDDAGRPVWTPDLAKIDTFLLKNAMAHRYLETHELALEEPNSIVAVPLVNLSDEQQSAFFETPARDGYAELGSPYFLRQASAFDWTNDGFNYVDGWVVIQPNHYRFRIVGNCVQSVIAEYLATEVRW